MRPYVAILVGLAGLLVLRLLFRLFLGGVGRKALAKQAGEIHLTAAPEHAWADAAAVDRLTAPLLERGFADAGTFTIAEMPVAIRLFAHADESACATIYEHPKVGVWMDVYSRYQDDTGFTLANTRDRGLDQRPGRPIVHLPGVGAEELLTHFFHERPSGFKRTITAEELPAFYVRSYAEQMAWRKTKGISAAEVARVAQTRQLLKKG